MNVLLPATTEVKKQVSRLICYIRINSSFLVQCAHNFVLLGEILLHNFFPRKNIYILLELVDSQQNTLEKHKARQISFGCWKLHIDLIVLEELINFMHRSAVSVY